MMSAFCGKNPTQTIALLGKRNGALSRLFNTSVGLTTKVKASDFATFSALQLILCLTPSKYNRESFNKFLNENQQAPLKMVRGTIK